MVSFTVLVQVIDECAVGTDLLVAQNQAPVTSAHARRERLLRRRVDELDVLRQERDTGLTSEWQSWRYAVCKTRSLGLGSWSLFIDP